MVMNDNPLTCPSVCVRHDNTEELSMLGTPSQYDRYTNPTKELLECFPNAFPERDYRIEFVFKEWSSLCPKTGQPDTGQIIVQYVPDLKCVETKSLKVYFLAYRNEGMFMETIVNNILSDLVDILSPRAINVTGIFATRGGTDITIQASYSAESA